MFQGVPRWIIAGGVVLIAGLEIVSRLPDILLIPQRLAGQAGEYGGKAGQPALIAAQTVNTEAAAQQAETQAQLNAAQRDKVAAETRVAQLQAALTAAQTEKTEAEAQQAESQAQLNAAQQAKVAVDARLSQAQTAGTNLDNANKTLGLAAGAIMVGLGAKFFGDFGHALEAQRTAQEPSQEPAAQPVSQPASPFEAGRVDWHRWHDWEHGLSADGFAGAEYWAGVRTTQPPPDCRDGAADPSADFLNGCAQAQRILAGVDQARHSQPAYRDGWNAGAKETGDL